MIVGNWFSKTALYLVLAMAVSCLIPDSASAQLRICGPGETPVGWDNRNPSVPVPLCPGGSADAPSSSADSYAGMAYHPDASDVWVIGGYRGSGGAVEQAIAACNAAMGSGCKSDGDWWNTHLEVIGDAYGDFRFIWGANGKKARKQLMADCQKNQVLPCVSLKKFPSHKRQHLPGLEVRKIYASSASVEAKGRKGAVYIVTGLPTWAAAEKAAVAECSKANPGQACAARVTTGSGILQTFRGDDRLFLTTEINLDRAQQAAKAICKEQKAKSCTLDTVYDARKPGMFVHAY